jgi:septum formation protein
MPGTSTCPRLVLASSSPRRRDLLTRAQISFDVIPAEIDENFRPGEAAPELVRRLALEKALAVARRVPPPPRRLVLGADTLVVLDGEILGKPADAEQAVQLLKRLVGRTHQVVTGVALVDTADLSAVSRIVVSRVAMRAASEAELHRYVAGGEPLDKAGAYAAQGEGRRFIERIDGSESNVIGLPLDETLELLRSASFRPEGDA